MRWEAFKFHTCKLGEAEADYADALQISQPNGHSDGHQTFYAAIADGAADSAYADIWAKKLVRSFIREPFLTSEALQAKASSLGPDWRKRVFSRPLSWFAEEKASKGSFAAFVGLTVNPPAIDDSSSHWNAIAIGDSCLFVVRDNALETAFPVLRSSEFDISPLLLCTDPSKNKEVWERIATAHGHAQDGDLFILATDALSAWFLRQHEAGARPWETFIAFLDNEQPVEAFTAWVAEARRADALRNDDTTLLILREAK